MPKIKVLTQTDKIREEIADSADKLDWRLHQQKISYTKIASLLNVTPAAISTQFRRKSITYPVWVVSNMLLNEEIK